MRDIALSNIEHELKELQLRTVKKTIFEIKENLYEREKLFRRVVHSQEAFNILSISTGDKFEKLLKIRRSLQNKKDELWNIICDINEITLKIETKIREGKL